MESLNTTLRQVIKTRGSFPSEQAVLKLLYLDGPGLAASVEQLRYPLARIACLSLRGTYNHNPFTQFRDTTTAEGTTELEQVQALKHRVCAHEIGQRQARIARTKPVLPGRS